MAITNGANNSDNSEDDDIGEQVRVFFVLDPTVKDKSLEVPSEPISVPAKLRRRGLSAVINHLLDRRVAKSSTVDESDSDDESDDDDDKLPSLPFEFLLGGKLLRTGVELAARRHGLSLEDAIPLTYFPAQEAPEESGQAEPLPDWISALSAASDVFFSGCYDGCIRVHDPVTVGAGASTRAHEGPIKCLATTEQSSSAVLVATGSLDQTLSVHCYDTEAKEFKPLGKCDGGHTASIGCVAFDEGNRLVSGDWNGGLCIWSLSNDDGSSSKKLKSTAQSSVTTSITYGASVTLSAAHGSQISGVSWMPNGQVVTGSWDHSVKVWDVPTEDCLLALNGSRVVTCLDLSKQTAGVVATGHADRTLRLWDVRTKTDATSISDNSLQPSHKAWVSSVQWSGENAYQLRSTSYDGTLKVWDIRGSTPLSTVRTHDYSEHKSLCQESLHNSVLVGGSDCVVKKYTA